MTHSAIKASCIFAATFVLLCGCSPSKEQAKTESQASTNQRAQTTPSSVEKSADEGKGAAAANTNTNVKKTAGNVADTTKPKLEYFPKPAYPQLMQERCIEGEVRVTMRINTDGKPEDIKIAESTNPAFSEALLNVLPSWRFKPAEKDGVAVARTVSIAIPFIINNRPVDLPPEISNGKPELLGLARPPHPGKGAAKAIVEFTITSDTIVSNVDIIRTEGTVDKGSLLDSLGQWVFLPSRYSRHDLFQTKVMAEITFTGAGNVLIQYPYPTPTAPASARTQTLKQ